MGQLHQMAEGKVGERGHEESLCDVCDANPIGASCLILDSPTGPLLYCGPWAVGV